MIFLCKSHRLRRRLSKVFGLAERKGDGGWVKQCMLMEIEGTKWSGCLRKIIVGLCQV